jgi:hypothetical protein
MKKKIESGKRIWKIVKAYMFKHQIKRNLKKLVKRIKTLKKVVVKYDNQIKIKAFTEVKNYVKLVMEQERI